MKPKTFKLFYRIRRAGTAGSHWAWPPGGSGGSVHAAAPRPVAGALSHLCLVKQCLSSRGQAACAPCCCTAGRKQTATLNSLNRCTDMSTTPQTPVLAQLDMAAPPPLPAAWLAALQPQQSPAELVNATAVGQDAAAVQPPATPEIIASRFAFSIANMVDTRSRGTHVWRQSPSKPCRFTLYRLRLP